MAKAKTKIFHLPGLHGDVIIKVVNRTTIHKHYGKRLEKGTVLNGLHIPDSYTIYIAKELEPHARVTTLFHELSHSLFDNLGLTEDSEEVDCDVLGGWLGRVIGNPDFLAVVDEISRA